MTDDQRLDDMKALPKTRRKIGDRGAAFTESFASFPLCCPSRATYLTGRYAHNHGVLDNKKPDGGFEVFRDSGGEEETVAVALDEAGYRTAFIGKYLSGYGRVAEAERPPYVPPGYDRWQAATRPGVMWKWRQVIGSRVHTWGKRDRHYQTDVYARQARRFIESAAARGRQFFLTVATLAPHRETKGAHALRHNPRPAPRHRGAFPTEPLPRSPSFNEADVDDKPSFIRNLPRLDRDRRRQLRSLHRDRLASMRAVDDLMANLVRTLARAGALGDTLLIFTSDNGYALGEHRRVGKSDVYDPATRVPLLLRGPGVEPGTVSATPAVNVDIAATIYDFTGVEPAQEQDGISLLEVAASREARELLLQNKRGTAIRTADWLYAEHETKLGTELELYDLAADPHQLDSLHEDRQHTRTRVRLAARLAELRVCQGTSCH